MVYLVKPMALQLLILLCCVLRLTLASCTLEISSQTDGKLSCSGCSLLFNNNNCNLFEVFDIDTNYSGTECNRTYYLRNTGNNEKGSPIVTTMSETTPSTTENKDKGSTPEHALCTPATVTVCPTQTTSLTKAASSTTDLEATDPQLAATTVQHTDSDSDRKVECPDRVSVQAMGAVIGLLVALLVVMSVGYIYICWSIKKRGELRIISKQMASFPNTRSITNTLNRTDKTLRQFNNPMYDEGDQDGIPQTPPIAAEVKPQPIIQLEDGEPAYEAIPTSGMNNRQSFEISGHVISHHETNGDKKNTECGGVPVGVASVDGCGHGTLELELSQVGLEDEDIENHYHLIGSEEFDRQSGQELRDADVENHYHLLDSKREDERNSQTTKVANHHHILEQKNSMNNDIGTIESDYYLLGSVEEAVEQEREERVYHVLGMPGHDDNDYEDPDEGDLFRDYDKRKKEREIERSTRAYEVSGTS